MVTRLSDQQYDETGQPIETMACEGCGRPQAQCSCAQKGCCGGSVPPIVINNNVDSNNREGYNTLNPGSIDRSREVIGYPVNQQVVDPRIVTPGVYSSPLVEAKAQSASSSSPAGTKNSDVHASPNSTPTLPVSIKKKRVFFPEFL